MSVLKDLISQLIQGERVDELTLVYILVHPLHSVWVALSTAECVAGHWLIGLVETLPFWDIIIEGKVLMVSMCVVCL